MEPCVLVQRVSTPSQECGASPQDLRGPWSVIYETAGIDVASCRSQAFMYVNKHQRLIRPSEEVEEDPKEDLGAEASEGELWIR